MAVLSLCRSGTLPRLCAFFVALSTGALFVLVGCFALPVLWSAQGGLIFSWVWLPPKDFGILPMLAGSLILSFSALLLAWPLSLGLACALQAPASSLWRRWLTALIRFMTAIPTVVYGFAAVFLLTPLVREAAGQGSGLCWLSAACVLALLISPTMVLVMDVALGQQMRRLLLPALALGMTRDRILACLALPAARRWLLTAGLLGFGRAIGDTLIPLMLSGNAPHLPQNLFAGLRTLTAHMGLVTATDVGGPAYNSLFVAGGFLLCISTGVSLVLRRLEKRSEALLPSVPAFWRQAAPAGLCLLSRGAGLLCSVCVLSLLAFSRPEAEKQGTDCLSLMEGRLKEQAARLEPEALRLEKALKASLDFLLEAFGDGLELSVFACGLLEAPESASFLSLRLPQLSARLKELAGL